MKAVLQLGAWNTVITDIGKVMIVLNVPSEKHIGSVFARVSGKTGRSVRNRFRSVQFAIMMS